MSIKQLNLAIFLLLIIVLIFDFLFIDMERLPIGEYLNETTSPDGMYTVKFYCNHVHSTVAPCILGVLHKNEGSMKPRKIFWQYRKETVHIEWLSDSVVLINGHALNILVDTYDFRWEGY